MLGHLHKIAGSKYGMGTEVAKCVLGQNSSSVLFQSTQQKKGCSCNGSYLAIEWCLANGVSHSLHITETVHKHWPYEMNYVILQKNST